MPPQIPRETMLPCRHSSRTKCYTPRGCRSILSTPCFPTSSSNPSTRILTAHPASSFAATYPGHRHRWTVSKSAWVLAAWTRSGCDRPSSDGPVVAQNCSGRAGRPVTRGVLVTAASPGCRAWHRREVGMQEIRFPPRSRQVRADPESWASRGGGRTEHLVVRFPLVVEGEGALLAPCAVSV